MKQPQLTQKVEQALLSRVEQLEQRAIQNRDNVPPDPYIKLAELYRFHQQPEYELAILKRFLDFGFAEKADREKVSLKLQQVKNRLAAAADQSLQLEPIHAGGNQIDTGKNKQSQDLLNQASSGASSVSASTASASPLPVDIDSIAEDIALMPREEEQLIQSRHLPKAKERELADKPRYSQTDFKFITVCAAWTGSEADDEMVELSLVLAEKKASEKSPTILEALTMRRQPRKKIPPGCINQFGLNQPGSVADFDKQKVKSLFASADFVVSHNNPDIERQVLAVLMPELADKNWYSIQKGIPWKALGFENVRLSTICRDLHIRMPSTTMGRAKAIFQILCQPEPFSEHIFLRRIYNLPPIKTMEWTPALRRTAKRLARNPLLPWIWGAGLVGLILLIALWYFSDRWLPWLSGQL